MIDFNKAKEEIQNGFPNLGIDSFMFGPNEITINWFCANIGFGQLCLYRKDDDVDHLYAQTEGMSKEFVSAVFREILKQIIIEKY